MRRTEVRSQRRWWLNPPLLVIIFVAVSIVLAVSGSLDERPTRQSGNQYWETFVQRPALPLEDAAILGTWRRDIQLSADSSVTVHCGLRSYGLTTDGKERFLDNVSSGRAEGWARAEANEPLPDLISRKTPCLREPDTFMSKILSKISAAWNEPQNPRYRRVSETENMIMRGVFDDRSDQVFVWFAVRSD